MANIISLNTYSFQKQQKCVYLHFGDFVRQLKDREQPPNMQIWPVTPWGYM